MIIIVTEDGFERMLGALRAARPALETFLAIDAGDGPADEIAAAQKALDLVVAAEREAATERSTSTMAVELWKNTTRSCFLAIPPHAAGDHDPALHHGVDCATGESHRCESDGDGCWCWCHVTEPGASTKEGPNA